MEPTLDENFSVAPVRRRDEVARLRHEQPDFYEAPRWRLPPMIVAGLTFMGVAVAFYGAETVLPPEYKPHHFMVGFDSAMANARAEGELAARIKYDRKSKLLETAAAQLQEACRAQFQRSNALYQAAWQRANTGYQIAADMQRQYLSSRMGIASSTVGGEINAANTATTIGLIGGFFDPEFQQKSMEYAETMRQQALQKVDEAAQSGIKVNMDDWNKGLPDPAALPPMEKCSLPAELVSAQSVDGTEP